MSPMPMFVRSFVRVYSVCRGTAAMELLWFRPIVHASQWDDDARDVVVGGGDGGDVNHSFIHNHSIDHCSSTLSFRFYRNHIHLPQPSN